MANMRRVTIAFLDSISEEKGGIRVEHLGDITKLNGNELPAVDVVIGGSPC